VIDKPKFRRRKDARPGEIIEAALDVFADHGFAQARLDDIAERAGVSKGSIYLHFSSKEDLFRAVVTKSIAPNVAMVRDLAHSGDADFVQLMEMLPRLLGQVLKASQVGAVAKIVIGESRNFPALALHWHNEVVNPMLSIFTNLIAAAQHSGRVRSGEPRLFAVQLAGPVMLGFLWHEIMEPIGAEPIPFEDLLHQHVQTMLRGMLINLDKIDE